MQEIMDLQVPDGFEDAHQKALEVFISKGGVVRRGVWISVTVTAYSSPRGAAGNGSSCMENVTAGFVSALATAIGEFTLVGGDPTDRLVATTKIDGTDEGGNVIVVCMKESIESPALS